MNTYQPKPKTLSVQQPWAWAITDPSVDKDIENRSWHTGVRGRILIHAGKKIDKGGIEDLADMGITCPDELQTGGIVGQVEIVDCVSSHKSRWFFGRFGFVLANARPLPFLPCRGSLGFFTVDYALGTTVERCKTCDKIKTCDNQWKGQPVVPCV